MSHATRVSSTRWARVGGVLLLAMVFLVPMSSARVEAATSPQITSTPALFPAFSPLVHDYVVRCTGSPVQVAVNAPSGVQVGVSGQGLKSGSFTANVKLAANQEFKIRIVYGTSTTSYWYYVRCLPSDFPTWTMLAKTSTNAPQAQWYVVTPLTPGLVNGSPPGQQYLTFFSAAGVPVYWLPTTVTTGGNTLTSLYATYLSNGDVAWTHRPNAPGEEHKLDGSLVRTVGPTGKNIDLHDLVLLPSGNYLVGVLSVRSGVNLSSWGGSASGLTNVNVLDQTVEEVTPTGAVVWSWDAADHIAPSETAPEWRAGIVSKGPPYDIFHWNSAELDTSVVADGPSTVVSFRHLDAVYKFQNATGNVIWKLGGSSRSESLTLLSDPVGGFGGQHDARVLSDGTLTVHDNGTNFSRAARAVHYSIDETQHTATWLAQVSDPTAIQSVCCGSARLLPGGDWVVSWGGTQVVTELDSSANRVFGLSLDLSGQYSFRAIPVLPGQLTPQQLRAAMDLMHPR